MRRVEGGFVERNEAVGEAGVVVEVGVELGFAVAPGVEEAAVGAVEVFADERGGLRARLA